MKIRAFNPGSVSGASFIIRDHYILAIFFDLALHERSGSLSNFMLQCKCFLSFRHFVRQQSVKPGTNSQTKPAGEWVAQNGG